MEEKSAFTIFYPASTGFFFFIQKHPFLKKKKKKKKTTIIWIDKCYTSSINKSRKRMSAFGFLAAIPLFLWSVDVEPHTKGWFITTRFWFSVRTRAVRSRDNLRLNIIVARNKIPDFNVFVEYVQRYRNGYAVRKITGTQVSFFSFFSTCVCESFFSIWLCRSHGLVLV